MVTILTGVVGFIGLVGLAVAFGLFIGYMR